MAIIRESYNNERLHLGEHLPLNTPWSVIIDVSERCNFRCSYCFRSGKKDESWGYAAFGENMSWAVFERAAKQLAAFPQKIKSISLSGHGEPLCNPRIADMTKYLNNTGVTERVEMHTNASLLTEDNAASIAKAGFAKIIVSIQGLDATAYERVCAVKINWDRFYSNLKLLYANKDENLKVHIKISNMALDNDRYQEDERRFYSIFGDIADSVYIEKAVPLWRNISIGTSKTENKFGNDVGDVDFCPLVFYKLIVAPDGEIYPCTGLPTPISLGNIRDVTLREAWNGHKRRDFLIEHLRLTRHSHKPCIGCFVPVNTVMSREDIIDPYKEAILERMEKLSYNG